MKSIFSAALSVALICGVLLVMSACGEDTEGEDISAEEISYVSEGTETVESLKDVIASYFSAVVRQDYVNITRYTTEDFIWNYDETGFYDYSRYITDFSVTEIETGNITVRDGEYTVPVSYTLTYSEAHTDENGGVQEAGEYGYSRNFIITYKEERYLISDITERVMG